MPIKMSFFCQVSGVLTNGLRMWGHFLVKDPEEFVRIASLGKESPGQS